jgi:hypothetical protein
MKGMLGLGVVVGGFALTGWLRVKGRIQLPLGPADPWQGLYVDS